MEKEYSGSITLGASTPTYDLESEPTDCKLFSHITEEDIRKATLPFIGEIMQTPPAHSAIQINGKRAYDLARAGKEVKLEPRKVTISAFDITEIALPIVKFTVVCSTGTYIRSLANDFGNALGVGGYLSQLVRTRIGEFYLKDALTPQQIQEDFLRPITAQP
jgi:tRNA pseudouridine55 synthase